MSLPVDHPLAERLWEEERTTHEPDQGDTGGDAFHVLWATWHGLKNAWQAMFGKPDVLAAVADADECPDDLLDYAAALNGVRLPAGSTVETQRTLVRTRPAARRGTPAARTEGIQQQHLSSPTDYCRLDEQVSSAYTETLTVRPSDIATSFAEIQATAQEMKPAGIVLTVQQAEALWGEEAAAHAAWGAMAQAHATWGSNGGH